MITIKWLSFFILFFTISLFPQTTYYVSNSQGNDSNSGTSENSPFKSVGKVNSLYLVPGDNVLFKKGDIWGGEVLAIRNSGTANNRIIIGSYGSGNKPVITLREQLPGWKDANNWQDQGNNIWLIQIPGNYDDIFSRMWFNGVESALANKTDGDNSDGTYGLCPTHLFFTSSTRIFVYSTSNPAYAYSNIEYPGKITSTKVYYHSLELSDADYVTIDGLDLQGGLYCAVGLDGSDYVIIKNCNIGKYSNRGGIKIGSDFVQNRASEHSCDYVSILNDIIDSNWKQHINFQQNRSVEYGISVATSSNYSTSHLDVGNCFIIDWKFGFFNQNDVAVNQYQQFHDNEVCAPDISYGKPIQIGNEGTRSGFVNIYRNYFHDYSIWIQIMSGGNNIYFNIFKNALVPSLNVHSGNTGDGTLDGNRAIDFLEYIGWTDKNNFFNNTIDSTWRSSILSQTNSGTVNYFNNLIVSSDTKNEGKSAIDEGNENFWGNNYFYSNGRSSSSQITLYKNVGMTINQFNAVGSNSGNIVLSSYPFSDVSSFSLSQNSKALSSGVDISSYVPEGFTDRNGNVVNRTNPNIGAIDNEIQESTGFKVYLEGPYKNGSMSTSLNNNGFIPKSQPYNINPWNYGGNESVIAVPKGVVDWLLVELRSSTDASSIIARKAAFLRSDGFVTALDGISPLTFGSSLSNSYYIVIKHRNHLAIMSSSPVALVNGSIKYDFTISENQAYGQNSMIDLGNGTFGMYGGDSDGNGIIENSDIVDVSHKLFSSGYFEEDSDMNSPVNVLDYKLPNLNLSKSSNVQ